MADSNTETDSERFMKYDYAETKDFCKHFLTLVVAVLVFSLTFSEKVVGFHTAPLTATVFLGLAWVSMLVAVILCGVGLKDLALAGGRAVYSQMGYQQLAHKAYKRIYAAGACFVIALVFLIMAVVMSVAWRSPSGREVLPNQAMQPTAGHYVERVKDEL